MKSNKILLILVVAVIALSSCASKRGLSGGSSFGSTLYDGSEKFPKGRNPDEGNFIVLDNGQKIKGSSVALKVKLTKALVIVDEKEYAASDVVEMQNENGYFKRYGVNLIARTDIGPISTYKYYVQRKNTTRNQGSNYQTVTYSIEPVYVIEKGDQIGLMRKNLLKDFVSDSEDAAAMFKTYSKNLTKAKLITYGVSAASAVGAYFLINKYTKSKEEFDSGNTPNEPSKGPLYAGIGVGVAGVGTSYVVGRNFTKKNVSIWDIIDEYNLEMGKKKK